MSKCEDCGCGMSGGFCSNCHEEVFIAEQYTELKQEIPASISQKVSEHIDNPQRKKQAKRIRDNETKQRVQAKKDYFGE